MDQLSQTDRARVVACFFEGDSIRAISRTTNVARSTVDKPLIEIGRGALGIPKQATPQPHVQSVQCDGILYFVGYCPTIRSIEEIVASP